MVFQGSSVAISHTGKVRSNNQDSAYAGSNLFAVADGMGGHAGGDVASSIAINRLAVLDHVYETPSDAERALRDAIADTAARLIETVKTQPELAGLGTTVSALVMVDDYAVLAHIGDSRVYLYRDDTLTQITTDHTFVQRLVDSGRITPEEARYHPRRSVLMRVLGDTDADPELDTFIMPTQPGDRWLLCSDGLSGVVDDSHAAKALGQGLPPGRTADILLRQALDGGAPDNVTIVLVDVGGQHPVFTGTPTIVGSASTPTGVEMPTARPARTGWLHTGRQAANEPTHFEPAPEFLEELIEEDRRRAKSRRVCWVVSLVVVLAALGIGLFAGYSWTQTRYFVGADEDTVVVYRGIQQNIGPLTLSTRWADTGIDLDDLPGFVRDSVEQTITADSLDHAQRIVNQLRDTAEDSP
ncbi:serine/threonine-protein phosphatase [Microbacterium sp. Sa4CUA7]|uniref:Serine/threonine-protein phosphatase n=1 Tax=Microbacterium pullorum TaxID=2762236 RepID=A0ABR8S4P9_9MICO|nr:PP2C family serine/threonine-protein phosphatase [Microbacterium pullorum]MBD7958451.1 serine/threonine-protein phosphatase [Microbacterium pullorum]